MPSEIMVNGQIVGVSGKAVNLGHTVSTTVRDCITIAAKNTFWKCFNMFIANFGDSYIVVLKLSYVTSFVVAFMGHHCSI